jgi:hypothetical protein
MLASATRQKAAFASLGLGLHLSGETRETKIDITLPERALSLLIRPATSISAHSVSYNLKARIPALRSLDFSGKAKLLIYGNILCTRHWAISTGME